MTVQRRSGGRSASMVLTEQDLFIMARALGTLDGTLHPKDPTVTRAEIHDLWGRIKETERRLSR